MKEIEQLRKAGIYEQGVIAKSINDTGDNSTYFKYLSLAKCTIYTDDIPTAEDFYRVSFVSAVPQNNYFCAKLSVGDVLGEVASLEFSKVGEIISMDMILEGVRLFKKDMAKALINTMFENSREPCSDLDKASYLIQEEEAVRYLATEGKYQSRILTSISSLKSISVKELIRDILFKANELKLNIINFKNCKIHAYNVIDSKNTLEELEQLNLQELVENYLSSYKLKKVTLKKNKNLNY